MPAGKDEVIRARVSKRIKEMVERLADESGESESFIVREAIRQYVESFGVAEDSSESSNKPPAKKVRYKIKRKKAS